MSRPAQTDRAFVDEFPDLLQQRNWSIRRAASAIGVDPTHLSRALRGAGGKSPSVDLITKATAALGLPPDYFPEIRIEKVAAAMRRDPSLLNAFFKRVNASVDQ